MNNLNDTLPDLMRRATENLEPESTDLVERGMRRGATLRRRRTALLSVSGAGAVLATAGIIVGGSQLLGPGPDASVAGTPTVVQTGKTPPAAKPPAVTPHETLATLKKLVARSGVVISQPEARGGAKDGFNAAAVVVDDGKGASRIEVLLQTQNHKETCADKPTGSCIVRADGSIVVSFEESPEYPRDGNPGGVISNSVMIYRPDGKMLSLTNYNAPQQKGVEHTRPKPVYSVNSLIQIAESKLWKFPAAGAGAKPWKGEPSGKAKVPPTK
jgi:hypothetical protein